MSFFKTLFTLMAGHQMGVDSANEAYRLEQEEREMEEYQQKKERERLEKIEETKQNICPRCGDDARREMDITKPHSVWNCCPKCGKN